MLLVIDKSEGRYTAGLKSQVFHHAFRGGERQLAARGLALCLQCLLQSCFQVVDVQVVVAVETDEVVLVALMVAHEDVLAMNRTVVFPPTLGFLDGLALRVIITGKGNVVFPKVFEHSVLPLCRHVVHVFVSVTFSGH